MLRFVGAGRLVFNRALALQQEIYELCGFRPGYGELSEEMPRIAHRNPPPAEADQASRRTV
jgi:hypothetical protein